MNLGVADDLVDIKPSALLDRLEREFPLIGEMANTSQDSEWHAEGNVRIHTEWVISEAQSLCCEDECLGCDEQVALILGAALHDIGKVLTTREAEINGRTRVVSPHHPKRGESYVAPRISSLGLKWELCECTLGLIRHHHDPGKYVVRNLERFQYVKLARGVDFRLVYLLEMADLRGRKLSGDADDRDGFEMMELFRHQAMEHKLWEGEDPYGDWWEVIESRTPGLKEADYVFGKAKREFEAGQIFSAEEALAKHYEWQSDHPTLTILSGVSGAGKSNWVAEHAPNVGRVVLDDLRRELTGSENDQSRNGEVMQLAKERLREFFRKRQPVVWDATSLRRDGRSMLIDLAHGYHAKTKIVRFACPPTVAKQRNRKRDRSVPESVIDRQYERFEWPSIFEADDLETV